MIKGLGRYAGPFSTGSLVVGLLLLLAGGGYWLVFRDLDLTLRVILALGILGIAGWVAFRPEAPRAAHGHTRRTVIQGSNAVVMSVATIAILAGLNYFGTQYPQRADLTATGQNTLAPETIKVLQDVKQPIKVTGFFQAEDVQRSGTARDLMRLYSTQQPLITYDNVDPDTNPAAAQAAGIRLYGTMLFESGSKRELITSSTEQDITTAILKLTSTRTPIVLFLTGHGERSIDSFDRDGYGNTKQALQQQNYSVDSINFSATVTPTAQLAKEADLLVIAGPKTEFSNEDMAALNAYLDNGGRLLLLTDPAEQPLQSVQTIMARYQLTQKPGWVIDPGSFLRQDPAAFAALRYEPVPITEPLGNSPTVYPGIAALDTITTTGSVRPRPIFTSTNRAWLDNNPRDPNPDGKTTAVYNLAMLYEPPSADAAAPSQTTPNAPTGRAVFVGDSDFATNQYVNSPQILNRDMFGNMVNWAAQSESLITIRPKASQSRTMFLSSQQQNLLFFSSVLFLPLAVLLVGGLVWWRRR